MIRHCPYLLCMTFSYIFLLSFSFHFEMQKSSPCLPHAAILLDHRPRFSDPTCDATATRWCGEMRRWDKVSAREWKDWCLCDSVDSSPDVPCATEAGLRSLQGAQSSHSGTSNYSTGLTLHYKKSWGSTTRGTTKEDCLVSVMERQR